MVAGTKGAIAGPLPKMRVRPPRHARPLPGVRGASQAATRGRSGRVKRRMFNLAAVLSLLLCMATVVLWARSRWRMDDWTFAAGGNFFDCNASREGVSIQWLAGVPAESMPPRDALGWTSRAASDPQQSGPG